MDNKIIDESIQGQVLKFETKNTAGKKTIFRELWLSNEF